MHKLAMLSDYYEFSMANAFFNAGMAEKTACFDVFFSRLSDFSAGTDFNIWYIGWYGIQPDTIH